MIVFGLHSYLNEHFKWHSCRLGTIAIPWFHVHNFSSFANVFKYYIRLESKRKTGDVSETFSKQKELLCSGWVPCFVFSSLVLWDLVFRPFLLCFWQVFARLEKKTDISRRHHCRRGSRILKWGVNFCNDVTEPKPGWGVWDLCISVINFRWIINIFEF